jgi:D-alanyl-D-alanine carboxypeptidase
MPLLDSGRLRIIRGFLSCLLIAAVLVLAGATKGSASGVYAGIVVDATTGEVLYQDSADERRFPASLTKMMTLFVLFEELEAGRMTLQTALSVSRNAAAQPPSKLGVRAGSTIVVDDAIKALVTRSANDVAVVIAENISGSVSAFAERMTRTAHGLGMMGTQFRNPHGLPDSGNYSTARDLSRLSVALQVRFPRYFPYFSTRSFRYGGETIRSHNRLVGSVEGVDGIKTGFIRASGFNLATSLNRDGRHVVAVVLGGRTGASRDAHMRELLTRYVPDARRGDGFAGEYVAAFSGSGGGGTARSGGISIAALQGHPLPAPRPMIMADPQLLTASLASAMPPSSVDPAAVPVAAATEVAAYAPPPPEAYVPMDTDAMNEMIEVAMGDADVESDPAPQIAMASAAVTPANIPFAIVPLDPDARSPDAAESLDTATLTAYAAPETPAAGGWLIQIGAVPDESAAQALIRRAAEASSLVAAATPLTEQASRNNQTFVRARFAGFPNAADAERACAELMRSNFDCYAFRL